MKRRHAHWIAILVAVLLPASALLSQATTEIVTATIRDVTGAIVASGQITFELKPATSTVISGYARFTPQTVSCSINQSSAVSLSRTGNVVTATFTQPMTFLPSSVIQVAGWSDTSFDGQFTIATVPNNQTATWTQTAANSTATGGWISELRANPGPGSCTLEQNTAISPAGSYYQVCLWPYGTKTACFNYYALSNSVDLSTVVPAPNQLPTCSGCTNTTASAGYCSNATVGSGQFCAGPSPQLATLIQSNAAAWSYGSGANRTETLAFPQAVTAGQAILVIEMGDYLSAPNGANPPPAGTVTDTQGSIFSYVLGSDQGDNGGHRSADAQVFTATAGSTGTDTISAQFTTANHGLFIATLSSLGAFDSLANGGTAAGIDGVWQATITTHNPDVIIGVADMLGEATNSTNALTDDTWNILSPGLAKHTGYANPSQFFAVEKYASVAGSYPITFSSFNVTNVFDTGASVYLWSFQSAVPTGSGPPGFRTVLESDMPPQDQLQSGRTGIAIGGPDLNAPSAPSVATPSTGGSLGATLQATVEVTYVNAKGETTPSSGANETAPTSGTCPSSGNCEMVVTSPSASGDATGYNVYANTCAAAPCSSLTKQNASPIAIGTNYTWTTLAAGSAAPASNTSGQLAPGGACDSTTANVTGAAAGQGFVATPEGYPGAGFFWNAYPTSASVVTVQVCAAAAGTPAAEFYDVRVIP